MEATDPPPEATGLLDAALRFPVAGAGYAVVIAQCEKACYAYLQDGQGKVCADLWLWNVMPAPAVPECCAWPDTVPPQRGRPT